MSILRIENIHKKAYNNIVRRDTPPSIKERSKSMAGQKNNGNQDKGLQTIVLITAILNLIRAIVDLIDQLTG